MSSQMSAIELLKLGDAGRTRPYVNQFWPYIIGTVIGVSTACMMNFGSKRPLLSGIQKHIALAGGWCAVLGYADKKKENYYAEKDAVLRHYIELHPEDFPTEQKRLIADIIEPWIPIR